MRNIPFGVALCMTLFLCGSVLAQPNDQIPPGTIIQQQGNYVMIGWNELGMHCLSPSFKEICILPPYNTIQAIVIRKGKEPRLVTSGMVIDYSIDRNVTVTGKTDYWTYAPALFGGPQRKGIGLTGDGLTGRMAVVGDKFEASGVPVLPRGDNMVWNPYQRATLKLRGTATGRTSVVIPVSDEMNCAKCHASGGIAAKNINSPTVDANILKLHDKREGTTLMRQRPVLCAECHADPALGTRGVRGVSNLSLAMHGKHATLANAPTCYDCHPGAKTGCNRSTLEGMSPEGNDPKCDNCHGDLQRMAASLKAGRTPWLEEPKCSDCHGNRYSTGTVLYRNAKGHGGVYCVACHNSPHAWYPSKRADDNAQVLFLQKNNHALGYKACNVCHTDGRIEDMPPHGDDDD